MRIGRNLSVHLFQHTAARRRLLLKTDLTKHNVNVSTHSRAEAAADLNCEIFVEVVRFQHTAARRRLLPT